MQRLIPRHKVKIIELNRNYFRKHVAAFHILQKWSKFDESKSLYHRDFDTRNESTPAGFWETDYLRLP